MASSREQLLSLLAEKSFRLGQFKLSSGGTSDYYIDCRLTTLDAQGALLTGETVLQEIEARGWQVDAIGGLTMGADPIVVATSVISAQQGKSINGFLVRKAEKTHGTGQRVEGFRQLPARVVIVDDVCTTGASTIQAIEAAREFGFEIVGVLCLVEREEAGGRVNVEKAAAPAPFVRAVYGKRCSPGACESRAAKTMIKTMEWTDAGVRFLDQTKLPTEETYVTCKTYEEVADAIRTMIVRGAPAIGVAAAMGVAVGVRQSQAQDHETLKCEFGRMSDVMASTRPTAVNLFWAIRRMRNKFDQVSSLPIPQIKQAMVAEAQRMLEEDVASNRAMGQHGAALLPASGTILTHCNAGALASCGYGMALGVIRAAIDSGKKLHVFADETRPFLQGSRLTAWELMKDGIPTTVITDNMAGAMMHQGKIDAVIVGADRIAANGDVANKIGTYTVAILAKEHGIPFYVAAPFSTVDLDTPDGSAIPIEQRAAREVTHIGDKQLTPDGVGIENPAFDVTPSKYVTAIITERGVAKAPYGESLRELERVSLGA